MSPELFANQPYNHKSDIWALGCCVYEMATLKHAFSAKNINALMYKILQGKVPPLPSQFSEDLSNLVQLMMARDARQRPSVHDILRMSFIRRHIKMFLDRTSSKRRSGCVWLMIEYTCHFYTDVLFPPGRRAHHLPVVCLSQMVTTIRRKVVVLTKQVITAEKGRDDLAGRTHS